MGSSRCRRACARNSRRAGSAYRSCAPDSSERTSRTSRRNLPPRFGPAIDGMSAPGPFQEQIKIINERVAHGIDPQYVGELVREGVENDWPYIFTDTEFEPVIEARFAAIKQGFDRIRGREPRR